MDTADLPTILAFVPRERARALVRTAFPKRKWRVIAARDAGEFADALRRILVDAALVDIGSPLAIAALASSGSDGPATSTNSGSTDDTWKIAALAQEFPSAPFFAISPLRATDAPAVARCSALEFCDVIADGIDDPVARELVAPRRFRRGSMQRSSARHPRSGWRRECSSRAGARFSPAGAGQCERARWRKRQA